MSDAPYVTLPIFEETGYVILDAYDQAQDPREWEDLTFVDWKSSGDTRWTCAVPCGPFSRPISTDSPGANFRIA